MFITIKDPSDWQKLPAQGLGTVVDPMVFRCGELFLNGAAGAKKPAATWDLLNANLHAIQIFFDSLILNKKLPVFNYGGTFDMDLNFDQRVLTRINNDDEVLYDIDVDYSSYNQVKTAALTELRKIYDGTHRLEKKMADEVLSELAAAEYEWNPSLDGLEHELGSEEEKKLAAFLLGGLIFSGYAQLMESEHLLQPKRSRIFLAVSLRAKSSGHNLEDILFGELKKRADTSCDDLPWMPTFFPYLLSKADTPHGILKEVVKLRKSKMVADYRYWLGEVMQDWNKSGKISVAKRKDVRAVAQSIDRALGLVPSMPKVEVKTTVADVAKGKLPIGVNLTPTLERLWGWSLASLPGNRYRKLLTRAIVAAHEYPKLEARIQTVWRG